MIRDTLRAEWGKTWSVRSPWFCLAGAVLLTLVTSLSLANDFLHAVSVGEQPPGARMSAVDAVAPAVLLGAIVFAAFAMLPVTAEYTTGSVRSTFLAQPRRVLVLAAKTAVVAGCGLGTGFVVGVGALAATQLILGGHAEPAPSAATVGVEVAVVLAVTAAVATGIAGALRSAVGTLSTCVVLLAGTLALPDRLNAWTPGGAALRLLTGDPGQYPGRYDGAVAVAVLMVWAAGCFAVGARVLDRRDA